MYKLNGLVPKVGSSGKFKLLEPWYADPDKIFRCERISSLLDFRLSEKTDVLQDIYKKNGLGETEYKYALKNNIKIVTLKYNHDEVIHIPDNYLETLPDQGYVPYSQFIISVNLGLLPENINMKDLQDKINNLINEQINVKVESILHRYESKKFISWPEHLERERVRKSGIVPTITSWQRIRELEKENDILSDAINELESLLAH